MKILPYVIIGIIVTSILVFLVSYETIMGSTVSNSSKPIIISDKDKFSRPIIEQVINHTKLARLFGLNNNTNYPVDLYDWSKDGKFIITNLYISNKNYLVSIDPNGTMLQKLNTQDLHNFFPARISPSDRYVLFTGVTINAENDHIDNLYLYDMVTNTMKSLTNNTNYESGSHSVSMHSYDWLPNGNIIYNEEDALSTPTPYGSLSFSLWEVSSTGEKIGLLCHSMYYFNNPNFKSSPNSCDFEEMAVNPDGNKIVFADDSHLKIYNIDTNQTTVIPNFYGDFGAITRWIPNSSSIVYTQFTDEHMDRWKLGIMSVNGSFTEKDMYTVDGVEGLPVVSPDGKYIMFANADNDLMRIRFGNN